MGSFGGFELIIVFIFIISLIIPIWGIVMVVKDQSLDDTPKILWVIAILAFNILGFIAYMIFRASKKNQPTSL